MRGASRRARENPDCHGQNYTRPALRPRRMRPSLRYSRRAVKPLPHARLPILLAAAAALLVTACGGSSSPNAPTPTPLTVAQIQARYTAAAGHYNSGEEQIATTENSACDAGSATVSLKACQTALSGQRQLTIAYDNALRAIPFSGERRDGGGQAARRRRRHREVAGAGGHRPGHHRDHDPSDADDPAAGHRCHRRNRAAHRDRPASPRVSGQPLRRRRRRPLGFSRQLERSPRRRVHS